MQHTHFGWLLTASRVNEYKRSHLLASAAALGIELREISSTAVVPYSTKEGNILLDASTGTPLQELPAFVISLVVVEEEFPEAFWLLEHLESMGVPLLNPVHAVRTANDKMATYRAAAALGIAIPTTTILEPGSQLPQHLKNLPLPLVAKPNKGLKGKNVALLNNHDELEQYLRQAHEPTIVQTAVTTSMGRDLRMLLLDGTLLGSMERSNSQTFTSNAATGGKGIAVTPPEALVVNAKKLAAAMQLPFCSIDFLYGSTPEEFILCEVNANPGYTLFESVTGVDTSAAILTHCTKR